MITPPHTRLKYAFQRLSTRSLRMDEDGPTDRPTLIEARVRQPKRREGQEAPIHPILKTAAHRGMRLIW